MPQPFVHSLKVKNNVHNEMHMHIFKKLSSHILISYFLPVLFNYVNLCFGAKLFNLLLTVYFTIAFVIWMRKITRLIQSEDDFLFLKSCSKKRMLLNIDASILNFAFASNWFYHAVDFFFEASLPLALPNDIR